MSIPYADLPILVTNWITAHPYQTALHVVNGVVLFMPAAATVSILAGLGFTSVGPAAVTSNGLATAATGIMSYFSFVPAGRLYAMCQSAAMGGYGASAAAGAAQVGAVATSALGYDWRRG